MALKQLGTVSATSLVSLDAWSAVLLPADTEAVGQTIMPSSLFNATGGTAIMATGASHTNTTLDTLVSTAGGPLASIMVGDLVLKADVPPGTYVQAIASPTSVTLSRAATGSASGRVAFCRQLAMGISRGIDQAIGLLTVPGRGVLKVLPGDYVAIDMATGWPILVSGNAVSYPGSLWTLT